MSAAALAALPYDVFVATAVFARVGAFFMTAPALGDAALPPRLRLAAALAVAAALAPFATPLFAGWQARDLASMTAVLAGESLAGGFLGLFARAVFGALRVCGEIVAMQMGLSLAQIFDPAQEFHGAVVGAFLSLLGTAAVFATDLHHLLLAALAQSYALFAPLALPALGDLSEAMIEAVSAAFAIGVKLAAPFALFGLVFYAGAGLLNRLMPQAQVFFLLMPANLLLGLILLMLTIGLLMTAFLAAFEERVGGLL